MTFALTWSGFIAEPRKALLCRWLGSCDRQGHHLAVFQDEVTIFFFTQALCQFLDTWLGTDSSMGVPMNQRSCGGASTHSDRHQVINSLVTLVGQLKKRPKKQNMSQRARRVECICVLFCLSVYHLSITLYLSTNILFILLTF